MNLPLSTIFAPAPTVGLASGVVGQTVPAFVIHRPRLAGTRASARFAMPFHESHEIPSPLAFTALKRCERRAPPSENDS